MLVTKYTTEHKAGQIITFLANQTPMYSQSEYSDAAVAPMALMDKKAPKDYIVGSKAKTFGQKIVALAQYLKDTGQEEFSPTEIRILLKKMGDEPKNFSRDLNEAQEAKMVTLVDAAKDLYSLTTRGEDSFSSQFSLVAERKASVARKNSSRGKNLRAEITSMEILTSLENDLPGYHSLPTKADKILWILLYADKKGINALNSGEIEYLSLELKDRVSVKHFTAFNDRNIKNSFVARTSEGFRIQQKGIDHLRQLFQK